MRFHLVEASGVFVTIEGIEGSGKSTLLEALAERLRAAGRTVQTTREPGGTALGEGVRALLLEPTRRLEPLAEAFLVNAARAQLLGEVLGPALSRGEDVLCDRFVDSTLAYQGYGRGLDLDRLRVLCDAATGGLLPDCTILLDLPVAASRERLTARGRRTDRMEAEDDAFHERVRAGFLALATATRYCVLDGRRSPEELLGQAYAEIERRLTVAH